MLTLSKAQCIAKIKRRECFHAEVEGGAFTVKIDEYSPIVCAAIHNGHRLRDDLAKVFLLSDEERFFEEDPYTADLISSFPIQLIGNDSRFEYDLNRAKTLSTYFKTAWTKQVWAKPLTPRQRAQSHAKHQDFYDVVEAVISALEHDFNGAIVFDIHSYNYQRIERDTPTFNLGSGQIDIERWGHVVKRFERALGDIELPNVAVRAATDEVFQGRGYLISHINAHFDKTLVLPTEVKKVFMDESTGELYPIVMEALQGGFKQAITETAAYFMRRHGKKKAIKRAELLSSNIPSELTKLDTALFRLSKDIETLGYINPINLPQERKRLLGKVSELQPNFVYKQLNIDPYWFREQLYKLPSEELLDADIKQLYHHVIDNLATKIDLLTTIGTERFLYNSLKYYGEPSEADIANAEFILHAPELEQDVDDTLYDIDQAIAFFRERAQQWQLDCKIEKSSKLVAKAMVSNSKSCLMVNKSATFTGIELEALAHHELGIHMSTTLNAKQQPLKVFSLGLVGNTHTQEGLAIFSEYCSGNLTLKRLKELALRVVAVSYMLRHRQFDKTYWTLVSQHDLSPDQAFTLTTRVYRGGGFTKDHLYLKGFRDIVAMARSGQTLEPLLVGKTGLTDYQAVSEMIDRGMLVKPKPLFSLAMPSSQQTILDYLVSGIK